MSPFLLDISTLQHTLEGCYYTQVLMLVSNIAFLLVARRVKPKEKWITAFVYYAVASLLQTGISFSLELADNVLFNSADLSRRLSEYMIIVFVIIEFIVFYYFFYNQFQQANTKKLIAKTGKFFMAAIVPTVLLVAIFKLPARLPFLNWLSVITSVLILIPSFYYFYTLFSEPPEKLLMQEPAFWATTGIAFLHGVNIPVFIIGSYFLEARTPLWYSLDAINYFAYSILFLLLIVSLLCNLQKEREKDYIFTKTVST